MKTYQCYFDYNDILNIEIIKLINEEALLSQNEYIKNAYKHDFLLQINLKTVNGLTLKGDGTTRAIANVFIKVILNMNNLIS